MATQKKNQSTKGKQTANPFAKALAETEKPSYSDKKAGKDNVVGETLAKTGANFPKEDQAAEAQESLEELEKQRKKDKLRRKLHEKVNPVDQFKVYDAREKQVKEEINKLREELKFLAIEVAKFNKEVEVTLLTEVVSPGQQGKYYINFFQQLRAFIMMMRQKIKSARTWANQANKKKKKKKQAGLDFGGGNEAKATHDMLHHERYNAYSGG